MLKYQSVMMGLAVFVATAVIPTSVSAGGCCQFTKGCGNMGAAQCKRSGGAFHLGAKCVERNDKFVCRVPHNISKKIDSIRINPETIKNPIRHIPRRELSLKFAVPLI